MVVGSTDADEPEAAAAAVTLVGGGVRSTKPGGRPEVLCTTAAELACTAAGVEAVPSVPAATLPEAVCA